MRFTKGKSDQVQSRGVFAFHELPDVLNLLMPPWEQAHVVQPAEISAVGSQAIIETRVFGPIKTRWVAQHTVYDPPRMFEDVQFKGPFHSWRHRHIVEAHEDGTILRDEIDYEPPLGFIGRALAPFLVQKRLQRLFNYRHEVTRRCAKGKRDEV